MKTIIIGWHAGLTPLCFPRLTATTQGLNHSIACRQSDGVTIQTNILYAIQPKVSALA